MSRKTVVRDRKGSRNTKFVWFSHLKPEDQKRALAVVLAKIAEAKTPSPEINFPFRSRGEGCLCTVVRVSSLNQLICPKNGEIIYTFRPPESATELEKAWAAV